MLLYSPSSRLLATAFGVSQVSTSIRIDGLQAGIPIYIYRCQVYETGLPRDAFKFLEQNLRTVQVAERKKLGPGEKIPPAAPSPFYGELYGENTQSAQVWARPKVRSCGQVYRRPLEPEAKVWEACSCHEVSWKKLQVVEEPWSQGEKRQKDQSSLGCILELRRQERGSMARISWEEAGVTGVGDVV